MTDAKFIFAQFCISCAGLVVVYVFIFKRQRADACRFSLRVIRDDLFDFMWKNKFDFSTPGYLETRKTLNGLMRLTTAIGAIEFLLLSIRCSSDVRPLRAAENMPEGPLKAKLEGAMHEAAGVFYSYLFARGIFGICSKCVMFFVLAALAVATLHRRRRKTREEVLLEMGNEFGDEYLSPQQRSVLDARFAFNTPKFHFALKQ